MTELPQALQALAAYCQWIVWISRPGRQPGKVDKLPVHHATGAVHDAHDPAIWTDADTAIAAAARLGGGVGFVLTEADPFWFLDVDNCLQPDGRTWSPPAVELCQRFAGAAVEISQSGRGLHIISKGTAPEPRRKKAPDNSFDLYTDGRFIALTGTNAQGDAGTDHTPALQQLVHDFLQQPEHVASTEWTDTPRPDWNGPSDDGDLLRRMRGSRSGASAFGNAPTLAALLDADADVLARYYPPDQGGDGYDASRADAALAQHLAFWTGCDCERIERLMRQSALAREKWDQRDDYLHRTILGACARQETVLGAGAGQPEAEPVTASNVMPTEAEHVSGHQLLAVTQQLDHFKGCVYVRDKHRIYCPDGAFLDAQRFRAMYGGYTFAMDTQNRKTSTNAFEVFTESQAIRFPKAAGSVFRPELPPGGLIEEEGYTLVNTWEPIETKQVAGDPAPFLDFLARLLPDDRDREILLTYMASLVQNPGRKFQWWPVVQGGEGNGKTLLVSALAHAVGHRYTFLPNVTEIAKSGNKFNGWIDRRLFIGMEEIYVAERRDFLESFKTTVTNERLPVESKGVDQLMTDNRANGMMCTNHKDGVPITIDTRRYCPFFTAQQTKADKERDGMTGQYFPDLYDWCKGRGRYASLGPSYGFAVINHYLRRYRPAAEFDPAGLCQEAPRTSASDQAVEASRGAIEQEIIEATEEGRQGFAGGWVSSMALDRLLDARRLSRAIPPRKRRPLMQSLGYDWHPALRDGRTNNPVTPDGGRPRLYIRNGHIHRNLTEPGQIAQAYSDAQQAIGSANSVVAVR